MPPTGHRARHAHARRGAAPARPPPPIRRTDRPPRRARPPPPRQAQPSPRHRTPVAARPSVSSQAGWSSPGWSSPGWSSPRLGRASPRTGRALPPGFFPGRRRPPPVRPDAHGRRPAVRSRPPRGTTARPASTGLPKPSRRPATARRRWRHARTPFRARRVVWWRTRPPAGGLRGRVLAPRRSRCASPFGPLPRHRAGPARVEPPRSHPQGPRPHCAIRRPLSRPSPRRPCPHDLHQAASRGLPRPATPHHRRRSSSDGRQHDEPPPPATRAPMPAAPVHDGRHSRPHRAGCASRSPPQCPHDARRPRPGPPHGRMPAGPPHRPPPPPRRSPPRRSPPRRSPPRAGLVAQLPRGPLRPRARCWAGGSSANRRSRPSLAAPRGRPRRPRRPPQGRLPRRLPGRLPRRHAQGSQHRHHRSGRRTPPPDRDSERGPAREARAARRPGSIPRRHCARPAPRPSSWPSTGEPALAGPALRPPRPWPPGAEPAPRPSRPRRSQPRRPRLRRSRPPPAPRVSPRLPRLRPASRPRRPPAPRPRPSIRRGVPTGGASPAARAWDRPPRPRPATASARLWGRAARRTRRERTSTPSAPVARPGPAQAPQLRARPRRRPRCRPRRRPQCRPRRRPQCRPSTATTSAADARDRPRPRRQRRPPAAPHVPSPRSAPAARHGTGRR